MRFGAGNFEAPMLIHGEKAESRARLFSSS